MLAVTDHAFSMPGSPNDNYFYNLPRLVPCHIAGIEIIKGIEVNID